LRVAASDDFRVWAFGGCEVEEALGLAVGSGCGAFGKNVRTKGGIIGTSNTLTGDIAGAVGRLQALTSRGANGRTDVAIFGGTTSEDERDGTAIAVGKLVDSGANRLSDLDAGGEGGGSAGEESNGGSELHVCGYVDIGMFVEGCVRCSLRW